MKKRSAGIPPSIAVTEHMVWFSVWFPPSSLKFGRAPRAFKTPVLAPSHSSVWFRPWSEIFYPQVTLMVVEVDTAMNSPLRLLCGATVSVLLLAAVSALPVDPRKGVTQSQRASSRRRALLVGINSYSRLASKRTKLDRRITGRWQAISAVTVGTEARQFGDLEGPWNDVDLIRDILTAKYSFSTVRVLKGAGETTRASIIRSIQEFLIDDAQPGDTCVFYYSGHGSRVRNSKDPKGWDESIVPSDSALGAPDIRDKELARLFLKAIGRGVLLTAIFDSCHSGSIARGYLPEDRRVRSLPFDERDVADPPDFKDTPEDKGMLVLSASKDDQPTQEQHYGERVHGDFTWALGTVLRQPSVYVNEGAIRIFDRVVSIMKGRGVPEQPVLGGTPERRKGALFWTGSDEMDGTPTAAVVNVRGNVVTLKGGLAMGLSKDCELTELGPQRSERATRLRVTKVTGLDSCDANIVEGGEAEKKLESGALFALDRWVTPDRLNLKVYISAPVTSTELVAVMSEMTALRKTGRIQFVDDPTKETPSCVIQHGRTGWSILRTDGTAEQLGPRITAGALVARLSVRDKIFISLPPPTDLRQRIELGKGTRRELIAVMDSPADVQYVLAGRMIGSRVEYAWVRPGVMAEDAPQLQAVLPARTDWFELGGTSAEIKECAESLEARAVTLGKISGWLQIQAPASELEFPYKLALRRVGTGSPITNDQGIDETECSDLPEPDPSWRAIREGEVKQGDCYDLMLVADQDVLQRIKKRNFGIKRQWVYVFSIDSEGKSSLLFPTRGVVENHLPIEATAPPLSLTLNRANQRVWYQPPFGVDTYILLASDEELTDPDVLTFDGVIARGKGGDSGLANLIDDLRTGTRGGTSTRPTPLNWSIDRVFIRSVGKY